MHNIDYKNIANEILEEFKNLHKRFLERERQAAEQFFERRFSPFDFLQILTQDINFQWLYPLSALIAELDAFVEEHENFSSEDLKKVKGEIRKILELARIKDRYQHHLLDDPDFTMLHARFVAAMKKGQ